MYITWYVRFILDSTVNSNNITNMTYSPGQYSDRYE